MATQTILVVDDEQQWLQLITRVFESHGCRVLPAPSCAGAIALLKSSRPDCAVLDFNLSDGDATVVCAAIRACEPRIPVVIFSSDPAAEECVGAKHHADKFISKTAPLEELFAAVNALLAVRVN
jgi:DNA-binding response OmpR family regulator